MNSYITYESQLNYLRFVCKLCLAETKGAFTAGCLATQLRSDILVSLREALGLQQGLLGTQAAIHSLLRLPLLSPSCSQARVDHLVYILVCFTSLFQLCE